MTLKSVFIWLCTAVALGVVAAVVSNGPIRLLAFIGLCLIAFVLQSTLIRYNGKDRKETPNN